MNRRIFRTIIQLGAVTLITLVLVFFLDDRYRVLPDAIHNHIPTNHPGLVVTDIKIQTCSSLNPFSSCRISDDGWRQIDKDLYLGKTYLSKAYLHIQQKRQDELQAHEEVIYDVKISRSKSSELDSAVKGERWESKSAGLWVKKVSEKHVNDISKVVTNVDVLFGPDAVDPRPGWHVQDLSLFLDSPNGTPEPRLTIRKGPTQKVERPTPRIRKDGKFKIMQVADLHLATGFGVCRDAIPDEYQGGKCEADPRTLEFVERMINEEQPDFIVLSGDQVNGQTAPDSQSAIFKYSDLFAKYHIPYAGIFGNHDDEGDLTRAESMAIMEGLPYSLSTAGPETVDGIGNYIVEILARGTSSHSALTLYLLDTHSYSPDEHKYHGYDWLKTSQIEWFRSTAQHLKRKHQEYTHVHMDLAFIHIPLPEYRNQDNLPLIGNMSERPTAPYYNSNFKDALIDEGIVLVSCGHDHVNDYCVPGNNKQGKAALWMCYGGGSGFGGYGGYDGYHRRMRFFDFDMNEARITTWKRLEHGDTESRIDSKIIVEGGKVVTDL